MGKLFRRVALAEKSTFVINSIDYEFKENMKATKYLKRRAKVITRKLWSQYYFWVWYNMFLGLFDKKRFEKICIENLELASAALEENNAKHWITDGTLLGFYRDGGLIKGDRDIDLGMMIEDLPANIHVFLKSKGLHLLRINGSVDYGLEYTYTRKGANLDIFFFYRENDFVWHANWLREKKIRFRYPLFGVKKTQFKAKEFWAPENIEQYLELKYGKNWRVPIRKWNWATNPKNIF